RHGAGDEHGPAVQQHESRGRVGDEQRQRRGRDHGEPHLGADDDRSGRQGHLLGCIEQPTAYGLFCWSNVNPLDRGHRRAGGAAAPARATCTTANSNIVHTVTVTDRDLPSFPTRRSSEIVTAPATSTDALYNNLNAADVSVTNNDNDVAGVTVTPTSGLTTTE